MMQENIEWLKEKQTHIDDLENVSGKLLLEKKILEERSNLIGNAIFKAENRNELILASRLQEMHEECERAINDNRQKSDKIQAELKNIQEEHHILSEVIWEDSNASK